MSLIYVYCILPAGLDVDLGGIQAMGPEGALSLVPVGGVQALASEVGDEFSEASLNQRIRDLEWLSPRAVRHHEVVDQVYARAKPLLPLTFGAIFTSVESLSARLATQAQELEANLERLRRREQWDVKLTREQARFLAALREESEALRAMEAELAAKSPGTRFLLEKKLRNLEASEAKRIGAGVRSLVHETLSAQAVEAHRDDLTAPAQPEPVRLELRSSYLVEEAAADGLKVAVAALSQDYGSLGYGFELTGPWPAFAFSRGVRESLA